MFYLNRPNHRWGLASLIVVALAITAFGLAVAIGIPDPSGVIHGCYANSNGSVRLVQSAADCKSNETAITWNQAGPTGLQGPAGSQGPQGPAGQARAAGSVIALSSGPLFYPSGLLGWATVDRTDVGIYCLIADPSISYSDSVLILTVGSAHSTYVSGNAMWIGSCGSATTGFRVRTVDSAGQPTDYVNFTALVP